MKIKVGSFVKVKQTHFSQDFRNKIYKVNKINMRGYYKMVHLKGSTIIFPAHCLHLCSQLELAVHQMKEENEKKA